MRAWIIASVVGLASPVLAQTAPLEQACCVVTVGATWSGSMTLSSRDATESDRAGNPYLLFRARTDLSSALGVNARLATKLTPHLSLEVAAAYAAPELHADLSGDVESAASLTAVERIRQVHFEVAVVAHLRRERAGIRNVPFLTGGAGISRELHEGNTLVDTGQVYFVGGGMTHLVTESRTRRRALGLRVDARVMLRRHGATLDDRIHAQPVLGASAFVRF